MCDVAQSTIKRALGVVRPSPNYVSVSLPLSYDALSLILSLSQPRVQHGAGGHGAARAGQRRQQRHPQHARAMLRRCGGSTHLHARQRLGGAPLH